MTNLTPKKIVKELDKYIVGQTKAKKAVAIALRNRWRRQQTASPMREEIIPNNIELISMKDDILAELKEARIGVELWRYLLYITILLLLIEMIVSNAKKQR